MWAVVSVALLLFAVLLAWSEVQRPKLPVSLPWVGKQPDGLFAETCAHFKSFSSVRTWLIEGYTQYSKKGKSYIFPDFSGTPEIIVPNSKSGWLVDQADDVASAQAAHYDSLQGDYAFTSPYVLKTVYHEHVVHRNLARRLAWLIPGTWEELGLSFDETWGFDTTQWTSICVFTNMMRTIDRASNRMFVGQSLCKNEDYLSNMGKFAQDVIRCTVLMSFVSRPLRPLFGPFISIPNTLHWWRTKRHVVPLIKDRLENMARKRREPSFKWEPPNDYVTWHIETALAEGKAKELEPEMISRFLMPINFAAIHTTTFTITTALFNLLSSDPTKRYVEQLRDEIEQIFAEENRVWTKQGLNKMVKTDSAIRESMRLSNFGTRGCQRKVTAKDGLRNEDEEWTAPYGSMISIDIYDIHHDPEIYPDPFTYNPFRFSDLREEYESKPVEERNEKELLKMKQLGIVTTSETFLPFGHGRHACPGRFFVQHELKLLLAYMLMNYDVRYLSERPKDKWFGASVIPDAEATIQVRRRTGTTGAR